MGGGRSKEHLLKKLSRMQKEIGEKMEAQGRLMGCFQLPASSDDIPPRMIDSFPDPTAIFRRSGVVCVANKALMSETGISVDDIRAGKINLFDRITDENYAVLDAMEDVFLGEITMLGGLVAPLELFCRDDTRTVSDAYRSAVFFPVAGRDGHISHGAVTLMK